MKWKWDHISHFWTEAFRAMTGSLYCSFSLSPDWHISHRGCSITWMLERMWHLGQSHSWQLQPTWARNRLCYYRQLWPFFVTSHTTEKANTTATDLAEEREYKGGWHQNSTFQPERTYKPKKKKNHYFSDQDFQTINIYDDMPVTFPCSNFQSITDQYIKY